MKGWGMQAGHGSRGVLNVRVHFHSLRSCGEWRRAATPLSAAPLDRRSGLIILEQ
jgi:hypothetical protein